MGKRKCREKSNIWSNTIVQQEQCELSVYYLRMVSITNCILFAGKWNSFCKMRHCSNVTAIAVRSLALLHDVKRMPRIPRQISSAKWSILMFFDALVRNESSIDVSKSPIACGVFVASNLLSESVVVFNCSFLYRIWYCLRRSKLSQLERCCSRV